VKELGMMPRRCGGSGLPSIVCVLPEPEERESEWWEEQVRRR
jgi:hypothetical protein